MPWQLHHRRLVRSLQRVLHGDSRARWFAGSVRFRVCSVDGSGGSAFI